MSPPNLFLQLCGNAIVTASIIVLIGVGFTLVYSVGRFFHFAHGVIFTCGAYFTYVYTSHAGFALGPSIALGIVSATGVGCLTEIMVYRPLRQKGASSLVMLLASLGVYVVLQNVVSMSFGDDLKSMRSGVTREGMMILGARMTSIQVVTVSVSTVVVASLLALLKWTRLGKAMRAVGDDAELAKASGIDRDKIMLLCIAISSLLAGMAGVLVALDVGMVPTMGMEALMLAVVAAIVGGRGSILGVVFAALLLGCARHFGAWKLGSEWQDAIAYFVLLAFLLVHPKGLAGKGITKATV